MNSTEWGSNLIQKFSAQLSLVEVYIQTLKGMDLVQL